MSRRTVAALLVSAQLVLVLSACMSVSSRQRRHDGPDGAVAVRVFASDRARLAGRVGPPGVIGELQRQKDGVWETVFRSLDPAWTVTGLPPGRYRLRFPARLDDRGHVRLLEEESKKVSVRAGRIVTADVVLSHVSPWAVLGIAVAAVLLDEWLDDVDLPRPPLPPAEVLEVAFYLTLDLAAGRWRGVSESLPPSVTSHFPAAGALVAARRPRVVFAMSEPLRPGSVEAGSVVVVGEASGLIPGVTSYDAANWWVVWEPRVDLEPDDLFHVTLAADELEDIAGNEPSGPVSFEFRTAP